MFRKINLKIALSAVLMLPLNHEASGMDYPGMLEMKPEPGVIRPAHRIVNPAITLDQMRNVFADKRKKINMHDDKLNCVPCAISCYRWINDQTEYPKRIGKRESAKNIAVDKDFAELVKQKDNQELGSKVVRINLEDGSVTPLNTTFSPITLEPEGDFTTLETYLDQVPYKFTTDLSSRFRVCLLYLIYKNQKNKGHLINVYKYIEDSVVKTYIIDPQSGIIQSLSDFTNEYQSNFINYAYVWFDRGENTAGIEFRNNFIKIDDGTTLPCQGYISNEEGMDVEEDDLFPTETKEDRPSTKRAREENSDSDEPVAKKQKIKKEKSQAEEERKAKKREYQRQWMANKIKNETDEEREKRLECARRSIKKAYKNETEAEREERLKACRLRMAKGYAEKKEGKSQLEKKRKAESADENPSSIKKKKKK